MAQSENKPKLSDIARQTNTAKAARFSSTMIPAPPKPQATAADETPNQAPTQVAQESAPVEVATVETPAPAAVAPEKSTPAVEPAPAPVKATRSRKGGVLTIDEVINSEPPKGEPYPRQVRISERHHKLLRKLAFTHDVTQNHVLYNLLDLLEQAEQRDQQKGD
jgi:hypothetical protein